MEHIDSKDSLESKLFLMSICSIRIRSITRVIFEKPSSKNPSFSPDEIKYRVKKQVAAAKKRERARLLKKGESAKYTATRRQLQADIKDDFFL